MLGVSIAAVSIVDALGLIEVVVSLCERLMGSNSSNMSSGSSVVCGFHGCGRCGSDLSSAPRAASAASVAEESTIVVPFSRLAQPLVRLSSSKRGIH